MYWQDKISLLINQNDFIRAIVIIAIILIMVKATPNLQSILQTILLTVFGVFGIWVVMNIDYVVYKIFN